MSEVAYFGEVAHQIEHLEWVLEKARAGKLRALVCVFAGPESYGNTIAAQSLGDLAMVSGAIVEAQYRIGAVLAGHETL